MLSSGPSHWLTRFAIVTLVLSIPLVGTILADDLSAPRQRDDQSERIGQSTLPLNPRDGETVVFLGDSITHQCLYTQYVEDFFYTRYPDRRIKFYNAGVSGDKASDALVRFEEDVVPLNPDYVTILFGMNDGQYEDFNNETFAEYEVSIDGDPIGMWTHVTLGTKIEIQENPATPQYRQALRIAELNRDRNDKAIRPLRDRWSTVKGLQRRYVNDPDKLVANLAKVRPVIEELNALAASYEDQIYQTNRPVTHRWKVRLVEPPTKRKPR